MLSSRTRRSETIAEPDNLRYTKIALNNGADLNEIGPFGTAALHDAATNGHLEVVRLLVEQGADVGLRSQSRRPALELAREAGLGEVVASLGPTTKQAEPGVAADRPRDSAESGSTVSPA